MCQDVHPLSFLNLNLWNHEIVRFLRMQVRKLRLEEMLALHLPA